MTADVRRNSYWTSAVCVLYDTQTPSSQLGKSVNQKAYPYAATRAARLLEKALSRATSQYPGGLRAIAARLDMKQAVNLSRMANGRMPIPLERVAELAAALEVDPTDLSLAVIEQRAPSVYAILAHAFDVESDGTLDPGASRLRQMCRGSSKPSEEQLHIVGEVLADRNPSERWLKVTEVPVIKLVRELFPGGLTITDLGRLESAMELVDAAGWADSK